MKFNGKLLVIGCGSVSQCTLPLLLKHIEMPADKITIMDMIDNRRHIKDVLAKGVKYTQKEITKDNYAKILKQFVGQGDLIVDLAYNIDTVAVLDWCHHNGVNYINTSVELWDPYFGGTEQHPTELTLYVRQMAIRKLVDSWEDRKGPTAILDHGANPGLVSHFTKIALQDIAERILRTKPKESRERIKGIQKALRHKQYAKMAQLCGVKTIHISERDSQITRKPKEVNEFVNTWSVEGFREEGIAPAEMGWGTHEMNLPPDAHYHLSGPNNQICLARPGIKTWVRSWVPSGEIVGMVVRHGESFTISDSLTVWEDGKPVYRPTVHYAYCPCDAAMNSLIELEMRQFDLQSKQRILNDDILSGRDELGVLLMGHDFKSWWTGSLLDIEEARKLAPHQNATTLQVACSVLAAVMWMMANPSEGVCVPDDLPHDDIMKVARPYLGPFVSQPVDWTPVKNLFRLFRNTNGHIPTDHETWQFNTFLVR